MYSSCMLISDAEVLLRDSRVAFSTIKFWRLASTIQENTPKEQLLFLFDHIAVLQISLVMLFRGYISISFLPILSLI